MVIGSKVTDTGLRHVNQCKRLKVLVLYDCVSITDEGLENIDSLHELESLVLDGSAITD